MTYQPRTKEGQAGAALVAAPFQLLSRGSRWVGEHGQEATQKALERAGASPEVARRGGAAVGAVADLGSQAAGTLATGGAGVAAKAGINALRRAGGAAEASEAAGAAARGTQGSTPPTGTASPELSASGPPRPPMSDVGGGPVPAGAPKPTPNTERAQRYAARAGLNWARLGAGTRAALESIAQDSASLEGLDQAALRREIHLRSQRIPVPATRGDITQNPVQLRREAIAETQEAGAPIRDVHNRANEAVQANLEVLRGRAAGRRGSLAPAVSPEGTELAGMVRSPTKAPTEVGESLQGVAREKAAASKKNYSELYKKARETEPNAQVQVDPLRDLFKSNPDIQHMGFVRGWLNKARETRGVSEEGEKAELTHVTLNELDDLRKEAVGIARAGGTEGHYAGKVIESIDKMMEQVPAGAKAWKEAIGAFKKHQEEFKDQDLIRKLVSNKKGSAERALATEKTWKTIASGSVEQIKALKKSLLKGDNPQLRRQGARAWADLRGETVNRILEDARNVSTADETERSVLTEAALRRNINRIPRENLEEILGVGAVRELYGILKAKSITKRRSTESGTVPNALVMVEKILSHIPGAGKYAAGAVKGLHKVGQVGEAARTAREATETPLQQAAREAEEKARSGPNPLTQPIGPAMQEQYKRRGIE